MNFQVRNRSGRNFENLRFVWVLLWFCKLEVLNNSPQIGFLFGLGMLPCSNNQVWRLERLEMEPLGVMAHGAPCSCVLSSPSPPSPPLDPDCFWIVQMTVDCPLRGIVCAWGPFTPIYPWLILRLKCIWPNAEEWHLIDEAKSCSNKQVWPFDLLWSL